MLKKYIALSPTSKFCLQSLTLATIFLLLGIFYPVFMASQYFGCLVVLFAIIAEYQLLSGELKRLRLDTMELGSPVVFSADGPSIFDRHRDKFDTALTRWAHAMVVIGTLLWGFGDKL